MTRLRSTLQARPWLWTTVAALMVWGVLAALRGTAVPPTPPAPPPGQQGGDLYFYSVVAERVAAGEDYYRVLAEELPAKGYATRSVLNWRLPTLTWLNALAPSPFWRQALFALFGFWVIATWLRVMVSYGHRIATVGVPILAFGTVPVILFNHASLLSEIVAGQLIVASLAGWARGRWKMCVGLGAVALSIRELALPYVIIMAAMAWWESRRRELAAWSISVALFGAYYLWHAFRVLRVMPADGFSSSWTAFGGWGFVLSATHTSVFLIPLPQPWAAVVLVPIFWAGLWYWADPLGRRVALTVTGYFALFMVVGRPDNWYWGFLFTSLIPLGFFGLLMITPQKERRR